MTKRAIKLCKEEECQNEQSTLGYCRLHYLKNWKKIREKTRKKAITNLNKYVDHIMKKHPDNYLEAIKQDLRDGNRFQRKAEEFASDDFFEVMGEVDIDIEVNKILDNMKVDETF